MIRWYIPGAVLAAALGISGCQSIGIPADLSLSGGISEILKRGVHVSYSFAMEDVLPVPRGVLPGGQTKIGAPPP